MTQCKKYLPTISNKTHATFPYARNNTFAVRTTMNSEFYRQSSIYTTLLQVTGFTTTNMQSKTTDRGIIMSMNLRVIYLNTTSFKLLYVTN